MTQEQNKPVRSREEQEREIAELRDESSPTRTGNEALEWARTHIQEAEARGAAEQRRKDGEGREPVAWCLMTSDQQIINGIHVEKCHAEDWRHRRPSDTLTPLYIHPANVAALEGRIAELEKERDALRRQIQAMNPGSVRPVIHSPIRFMDDPRPILKREGDA